MIVSAVSNNNTFEGLGNKYSAFRRVEEKNIARKILKSARDKNLRGDRRDMFIRNEYEKEIEKLVERQRKSYGNGSTLFDMF